MSSDQNSIKDSYNIAAKGYTKSWSKPHPTIENERLKFVELLKENSLILDIGCAHGIDCQYFTDEGFNVHGIDISEKFIQYARANNPNSKITLGDINEMDFDDNSYDAVWASYSLLHIKKEFIESLMEKIKKLLKPGGIFFSAIHTQEVTEWKYSIVPGLKAEDGKEVKAWFQFWTAKEYIQMLSKHFEIIFSREFHRPGGPYPALSVIAKNNKT